MDIFELAKAKKMFGGGGGKREGTAIKAGEVYEKIYFNTKLTYPEIYDIVASLNFIQTPLYSNPIYPIYANTGDGSTGTFWLAIQGNGYYQISEIYDISNPDDGVCYWYFGGFNDGFNKTNGWRYWTEYPISLDVSMLIAGVPIYSNGVSLTDFSGLPIGTENEKIKNLISATPF